jgi:PPM family protein phosphatase
MIDDDTIARTVRQELPLKAILEQLVKQALDAGGDDNVTVVAFRVGTGEPAPRRVERPTVEMETPRVDPDTLTEADRVPAVQAPLAPPPEADRTPVTTMHPVVKRTHILPADFDQPPQRRSVVKPLVILLILVILAAAAVIGSIVGLRRAHFVGIDERGKVAVYEGVPFEFTSDHTLYRKIYTSPLYAAQLTPKTRHDLFDHELESRADAVAEVKALEKIQP